MSKGIGKTFGFGIAKEATRGTAESTADFWIPFEEMNIDEKDTKIVDENAYGVIEDSVSQSIVKQWAEGNAKLPVYDKSIGLILLSLFGDVDSAAHSGETLAYDHTYSVLQDSQHQSLTLFVNDPLSGQDYKHALGVVSSLELSYALGKYIGVTPSFKAKKGETATLTPSISVENKFLSQHVSFKIAANQAGLDAASAINVKSLSLKIDQGITDNDVLGSIAPDDFLTTQFSIEGNVELVWEAETYKDMALEATEKAMRIDIKNSDVTIGTAANPQLKIDLHKVIFKDITRPVKVKDLVMQTLSFKAHYNITDSKMVTAVLTNLQASY
jgi:hypothetical protein